MKSYLYYFWNLKNKYYFNYIEFIIIIIILNCMYYSMYKILVVINLVFVSSNKYKTYYFDEFWYKKISKFNIIF